MKRYFIALIFFALLIFSCKKDETYARYWGDVEALFNSDRWSPKVYATINAPYEQGIDIVIDKYNKDDYLRQALFIYKLPKEVGRYPLVENDIRVIDSLTGAHLYTLTDDGDVLGDGFILLKGIVNNYVEITKVKGDQIWGTFEMDLVRSARKTDLSVPDTIVLTDGKFHTRMEAPR